MLLDTEINEMGGALVLVEIPLCCEVKVKDLGRKHDNH